MPFVTQCACGAKFQARDNLLGTTVACPKCGRKFVARQANEASQASSAASAAAAPSPQKIQVRCSCGRSFSLDSSAAGRRFRCNACGAVVTAPAAAPQPAYEDYGDPLGSLDVAAFESQAPVAPRGNKPRSVAGVAPLPPSAGTPTKKSKKTAARRSTSPRSGSRMQDSDVRTVCMIAVIYYGAQIGWAIYEAMLVSSVNAKEGEQAWISAAIRTVFCGLLVIAAIGALTGNRRQLRILSRGAMAVAVLTGILIAILVVALQGDAQLDFSNPHVYVMLAFMGINLVLPLFIRAVDSGVPE